MIYSTNVINAISNIKLYNLRCTLVDEEIPEGNIRQLAITAKKGLEQARLMSLDLINLAIGCDRYDEVTEDTIMLSWNWHDEKVPEIFREVCYNVWFKRINDVNISELLDYYIEYSNSEYHVKANDEIIRAIYQSIAYAQMFFKNYDRIKAVIEYNR